MHKPADVQQTLLVIDDDPGILLLTKEVFVGEGYRVEIASSGEDALERIDQICPDVILLDILMPGMDGYEVCKSIKELTDHESVPIIMLTGLDDVEAVERSYQHGAWDFTSKPINWPILIYRLRYALRASLAFSHEQQTARLSRAIDSSPSEVILMEVDTMKIISANTSALQNLGYQDTELPGCKFHELAEDIAGGNLHEKLQQLDEHQQVTLNCTMQRKDGSSYPAEGIVLLSTEAKPYVYIGIFQDISRRKKIEEELHRLAFYDDLTGLPNRRLLEDHVTRALAIAKRKNSRCALCLLDLDGFKTVNDTLGHSVGDVLLKEVSHRLGSIVRQYDLVARDISRELDVPGPQIARLGGDEFLIVLSDFDDIDVPAQIAARVLRQIELPYNIHSTELNLTGSMGISLYPEDGDSFDALLMYADTAMYKAKHSGKNNYSFYTKEADNGSLERMALQAQLRSVVDNNELELHYQPQINCETMEVIGAEALVRWRHPEHGLRFPDTFIPLAEENGMILPIGEWVMRTAVQQASKWAEVYSEDFAISVNVSGYQIREDNFQTLVRELLKKYPLVQNNLIIELTESTLMSSAHDRVKWLHEIRDAGIKVAIDDFGTGYSSLSYLKKFPINYLKVDRSFVMDVETDREDAAIVKAIFRLAQALDLEITVEGVENLAQLNIMKNMGDCAAQGWFISKALPAAEFEAFLADYAPGIGSNSPAIFNAVAR